MADEMSLQLSAVNITSQEEEEADKHERSCSSMLLGCERYGPLSSMYQQNLENRQTIYASTLKPSYVKEHLQATVSQEGQSKEFIDQADLNVCLEELLEFSQLESTGSKINKDGVKTFDGCAVSEIISKWKFLKPNLEWLLEKFSMDLDHKSLRHVNFIESVYKVSQILMPQQTEPAKTTADIAKMNFENRLCAQFVQRFLSLRNYKGTSKDYEGKENTCSDQAHDKFKSIVCLMGEMVGLLNWVDGECKETVNVFEIIENEYKIQPITCKPDVVFCSAGNIITMPIQFTMANECYMDTAHDNIDDSDDSPLRLDIQEPMKDPYSSGDERDMRELAHKKIHEPRCNKMDRETLEESLFKLKRNMPQEKEKIEKIQAQHLFQHFSLMVKHDQQYIEQDIANKENLVSIGMIFYENRVYFTKAKISRLHMRSLIVTETQLRDIFALSKKFKQREEAKLQYSQSNWCLDIWKGSHRNALLFFLAHYMHSPICCIKDFDL